MTADPVRSCPAYPRHPAHQGLLASGEGAHRAPVGYAAKASACRFQAGRDYNPGESQRVPSGIRQEALGAVWHRGSGREFFHASPLVGGLASAPVHTRDSEHGRRLDNLMAGQKMGNDRDEWREEALQAKHESGGSDIARQKRRPFLRRHSVSDDGNTEREEGKGGRGDEKSGGVQPSRRRQRQSTQTRRRPSMAKISQEVRQADSSQR